MANKIPTLIGFVLFFQFLTDLVVLLDLAFLREILGFIYLTLIPGFLVLKALKLDKKDNLRNFLLSVGLGIALLMFSGLSMNMLLPLIGMTSPLSTLPLLVMMNVITLLACWSICFKHMNVAVSRLTIPRHLIPVAVIPLLSIAGGLAANTFGSNLLLLLMLLSSAGLIFFGAVHNKNLPENFYPFAVLALSISLLFYSSLATNYITGGDINSEYHVFRLTNNAGFWNASYVSVDEGINKGNAMLSVTILPTIYSKITEISETWILKILYPLILSFVPLVLYKLYSSGMKKKHAFLAVAFLISNSAFFATEGFPAKQMIAEFFFVLLFLIILDEELDKPRKSLLFLIFSAGLVVSHYALSYIFLFLILSLWLASKVAGLLGRSTKKISGITPAKILLFSVLVFGWIIYSSNPLPFNATVTVADRISKSFFSDLLNPSARTVTVLRGLGGTPAASLEHQIGRIVAYIAEFLIILGIAGMLLRKEKVRFGHDYNLLSVFSLVILLMCIVVPNFASSFNADRFYEVTLLFLAPFFVLGGERFFSFISKRKNQIISLSLISLVLVLLLLFETGFVYEVTGDVSYSVPLSRYRMDRRQLYDSTTDGSEVTAASWLSISVNLSDCYVYGDFISTQHVLASYGMIPAENLFILSNATYFTNAKTYLYLRGVNTIGGIMETKNPPPWNLSDIQAVLNDQDQIYSNGECVILAVP